MKKTLSRILAAGLCVLLVLALLPAPALAVETYTASEECIEMIKEFEDFRAMPYNDRGEWYIGYGSLCDPADYPAGISVDGADRLMREMLVMFEDSVNQLLTDYDITVTQYQFDAMVSMTYNLGTQWINPEYRFCGYLISGIYHYSEPEVVNAIATWCHQGSEVRTNLVARRLREAFLFLYGQYDNIGPDCYSYIHLDANGGSVENRTVFYPVGLPYGELPEPKFRGRTFLGWYTADGVQLTGEEPVLGPLYLTAKWDGEGGGATVVEVPDNWVNPYKDVADGDWYFDYVKELTAKGVVSGYPDGTFRASSSLTAGEALKLVLLAAGYQDPGNAPSGHWASQYLALAENLGCLVPGEIADLDGVISRLTIARVAAIAMGLAPRVGLTPFLDVDDGYTLALYEEGILNGTVVGGNRYYYPDAGINRAEMCAIVSRINSWDYAEKNDPGQSGYIKYGGKFYPVLHTVPAAPYNPDLFVMDGKTMYYNDPNYTTSLGIDVSSYQEDIDWQKVAASGIEFVFIRLGYRGYGSAGTLNLDSYFQQNLTGARAAGLKVGAYFFSQAISTAEAAEEAQFVLENLNGQALDYPLVYDWEVISADGARTKGLSNTVLTDCAITFCEMVAQAGYTPMVYYNNPVAYGHYQLERLTAYDVWFAQYASKPTQYYNYRIWQYTDSGSVLGIKGKVDMDLAFIPY